MSIKYYANKVQETSTSSGTGNLVLGGSPTGFKTFVSAIGSGSDNKFSYYIYRKDNNFEWEIGVGYILVSGGLNILVRERVLSSSTANNPVSFSSGTKFIESIISGSDYNSGFVNLEERNSSFSAPSVSATYIVDSSATSGVTVSLPAVTSNNEPVIMGFMLHKTSGNQYEQPNAILLVPNGSQTIDNTGSYSISIRQDYVQIASIPSSSGWVVLDPILNSTYPYGNDGTLQFKYNSAFTGVNPLVWDINNQALLVGGTGTINSSTNILSSTSGSTTVFNEQGYPNDLRIESQNATHLFFVDGSENKIGINTTSLNDILTINASGANGLTIFNSGNDPKLVLSNIAISGLATNNVVGSIVFSGLNSANNPVKYGRIYTVIDSRISSNENSSFHIEAVNGGSNEDVAIFSTSGVTLGYNSQNIDGIIIGSTSNNEGNNVVLGSFHDVCGENCVVIGDNLTLSSGTFGGAIGTDHAVSGNNIWVIGGSGVSVSGDNRTLLALNNNTHLSLGGSGSITYSTLSDSDIDFVINNSSVLASGISENVVFRFVNSAGLARTGLVLSNQILSATSGSENSKYVVRIVNNGSLSTIADLSPLNLIIGSNTYSGNNILYGYTNTVINSGNSVFGRLISTTGNNNSLFGQNISCSGSNNTIFGKDNKCLPSGNLGIVIVGNNNSADEDYAVAIGIDNVSSGLYSVSCGYMNGVHGDYSISVGESNIVTANGSVAIGRSNNISNTDLSATLFAMGIGNLGTISNTGIMFGYNNQLYGNGGFVVGLSNRSSGNNFLIGSSSIATGLLNTILGSSSNVSGSYSTVIGNSSSVTGNYNLLIGNSGSLSGNNTIQISAGSSKIVINSGSITLDSPTLNLPTYSGLSALNITVSGLYASGVFATGISTINLVSSSINTSDINISGVANFYSGINISSLPSVSGSGSVSNIYYQNSTLRSSDLAFTGAPASPYQLSFSSAEYQFIDATGYMIIRLPNGSGNYPGKKFTIANVASGVGNDLELRYSDGTYITSFNGSYYQNGSYMHAGNNLWLTIS